MATLQRFKFLPTQCGVSTQNTKQSPNTSPLIQFRRGKTTLKMLLSLKSPSRREQPLIHHHSLVPGFAKNNEINNKDAGPDLRTCCEDQDVTGHKLRDLFVSSPSAADEEQGAEEGKERRKGKTKEEVLAAMAAKLNGANSSGEDLRNQVESHTPLWFGSSKRLIQRAWRPRLGTIPE